MSSSHAILGSVVLGYAPMIDPQHQVVATRLTVFPRRPDVRIDANELLACLLEVWPDAGASAPTLVLNAISEPLLHELLRSLPPKNFLIEVPAFMATDPNLVDVLQLLRKNGNKLIIKGRALAPVPADLQPCFGYALIDLDDERLGESAAAWPGLKKLHAGVRSTADIADSFKRGASAVLGWPMAGPYEAPPGAVAGKNEQRTDEQVIVELMSRVDQGEDIEKLERVLQRDPSLAFKLLRYMNSAAFGLSVEVTSFRHVIMLLGYSKLKRWLALLLTTASKDHSMKPIMFAALRRGLLMEELSRSMGDAEMRDEMFICGLFSLLDHMLKQSFEQLLGSVPMPERVREALVDDAGPYQPYLELVRAIEHESPFDYKAGAERLMLDAQEINQAVMAALSRAAQLE